MEVKEEPEVPVGLQRLLAVDVGGRPGFPVVVRRMFVAANKANLSLQIAGGGLRLQLVTAVSLRAPGAVNRRLAVAGCRSLLLHVVTMEVEREWWSP